MIVYNNTVPHMSTGYKSKGDILTFIADILKPVVIQIISYQQWVDRVKGRADNEVCTSCATIPIFLFSMEPRGDSRHNNHTKSKRVPNPLRQTTI